MIRRESLPEVCLALVGGGLLIATAAIHLDLYLTGYRTIPTIGGLFLAQVVAAFVVGILVMATRHRLVAAAGALLALGTLAGYLTSLHRNLFGFREVRTSAGVTAGVVELAAVFVLGALALWPPRAARGSRVLGSQFRALGASAGVAIVAAVIFGVLLPSGAPASAGGGGSVVLRTATVDGTRIVTNDSGYTLYWFAEDTTTTSACNGECAAYWPPVLGAPVASAGLSGTLGTIRRSDGSSQATYDGHPLYTYVGDSAPGQNHGNDVTLNGGEWFEVKAS
jgi:predicted lipoprotein with Yx(FWY)xxD motif